MLRNARLRTMAITTKFMPAPKGNQYAKGNKGGGRPTVYKPQFAIMAQKACEAGFTDQEIADLFGVSETTVNGWKIKHPEFSLALKAGKSPADDRVERSLYHRAVGYEHDSVKIFMAEGKPVYAPYREHSTEGQPTWIEHGGPGDFEGISDEQLVEMVAQEARLLLEDKSKK